MSYAYQNVTGPSSLPSFASTSSYSPNSVGRSWDQLPGAAKQWVQARIAAWEREKPRGHGDLRSIAFQGWKRLFTAANALILLWIFTLRWGERKVFQESIDACVWESWERWPQGATPHHVAFVADPQLVDPHTYPDRHWPLSSLTVKYTDQYLRRSFESIQQSLDPDSVLFLGDLFDGGREWATAKSSSPEKQYQKYDDSFWKKNMPWAKKQASVEKRGRRMIASLPGNHDLGFGNGIQRAVRERFQTFFGRGNRVDVIGNHTFVSVDTVSLSAMDQPDPVTGSSSPGLSPEGYELPPPPAIWKDTGDFLDKIPTERAIAETEELRALRNQSENLQFQHRVAGAGENSIYDKPVPKSVGLPTVLLTHVPLYRKAATPCGPLREHYPPASPDVEEDEQNALKIAGGYQYQNVLTQTVSNELVTKAGPNIVQVYSGDDHDYCEVSHREFNGSPKEITVKSISWAMGVRHPGFVLTSLWNPIDLETGEPTQKGSSPTIQNHLCLLPDQLGIFIRYGCILALSILILLINSIRHVLFASGPDPSNGSILPLSERPHHPPRHRYQSSGTSSSNLSSFGARTGVTSLTRNPGAKPVYDTYRGPDRDDLELYEPKNKTSYRPARPRGLVQSIMLIGTHLCHSMITVARIILPVYFFLIWRW
ncbi:hypothetical protein N7512_002285 [Penicillium capsulatum]|nr:hypothetical protein N7512_002285 [Penicillium capsulatum]